MKRLSVIVAVIHPGTNVSYGAEYWAKTYWVHISIILKEVL